VKKWHLCIWLIPFLFSCSGNEIQQPVFSDAFDSLPLGKLGSPVEHNPAIYFQAEAGVDGPWTIATSLRQEGFEQAWAIEAQDGEQVLVQRFSNLNSQNEPLSLITHPMLVTGDTLWSDYMIEVDFTPMAAFDKCGVVFGYQHPNDFYFFGTEGNTIMLKHVMQPVTPLRPIERILAYRPMVWSPGEEMHAVVTVRRNSISTILNDSIRMYEGAEIIRRGRIGLISDLPAVFSRVEVKMLKGELRKLRRRNRQVRRRLEIQWNSIPGSLPWKKLDISAFGGSQNMRLGDLNGDGNKDLVLACTQDGDQAIRLCALNLNGEVLWEHGKKESQQARCREEIPFQIHDLDGDKQREVLFVSHGMIQVLDGQSGEEILSRPLPSSFVPKSMIFGDLLGTGRDNCLILTDRQSIIQVYNDRLELLWNRALEGGSEPVVEDLDDDGIQEVLVGYQAFNADGSLRFNAGAFIGDRCNGLLVSELDVDGTTTPCVLYAAGDWGLLYVDFQGNLIRQNIIGHVSYISSCDLNMEQAGHEIIASNGWGSDGLVSILDARGRVQKQFMPPAGTSRCVPVNWKGDGEEFFILNTDSIRGGMFNKAGELAFPFPSDGHPVELYQVCDLYGDSRDEVLVWNRDELWIYTQTDNPRMGNTYQPFRPPLYNFSFYAMQDSRKSR